MPLKKLQTLSKKLKRASGFRKSASTPIQWTTHDDVQFFPAGKVAQALPPGFYTIEDNSQGIFFARKPLKTEKLLKFPDSSFDAVVNEIENFWDLEARFEASEIPYKRGILLYGPPGSGKTCLLKIVVDNLINKHAGVVIDFGAPSLFREGYNILRQIQADTPIVALMEDVDAILNRYSESEVLNILDGIGDIQKAVFLATTNYPEKLGGRIMNRPSRFDKKMFIGMPSKAAREMFIRLKLGEAAEDAEVQRWVVDTEGFSVAHIKELFVASKILGDPYDRALEVLRQMKVTPSSQLFEDYSVKTGSWDGRDGEVMEGFDCAKFVKFPVSGWVTANDKYSSYGTGRPYKRAKLAYDAEGARDHIRDDVMIAEHYLEQFGDLIADAFIESGQILAEDDRDAEPFIDSWVRRYEKENEVSLGLGAQQAYDKFYGGIIDKIRAKM